MAKNSGDSTGHTPAADRFRERAIDELSQSDRQPHGPGLDCGAQDNPTCALGHVSKSVLQGECMERWPHRWLDQSSCEKSRTENSAGALCLVNGDGPELVPIVPIRPQLDGLQQIMAEEGIQAVLPIDATRAVAIQRDGTVTLWDLDLASVLSVWRLYLGCRVSIRGGEIQIRDRDGLSKAWSAIDGNTCLDVSHQSSLCAVERTDSGELLIRDAFRAQEPLELTDSGPGSGSRQFRLPDGQILVLDWGSQRPLGEPYADTKRAACSAKAGFEVSFRLQDANGGIEAQGMYFDDLALDAHREFKCVQVWGENVIAAVGTGGVFAFNRHDGRVVQLLGAPITTEFLGVYHAAALCSLPKHCGKVRLSSGGEVLLFGESGAVAHYEELGFGLATELRQPDDTVLDARFLADGSVMLIGSSGTLTRSYPKGGEPVQVRLPGTPVSVTSGPHGEYGIAYEFGFGVLRSPWTLSSNRTGLPSTRPYRPRHAFVLPTGRHLVTWLDPDSSDNSLRVYDLANGALAQEFEFEGKPGQVLISPAKNVLVAWNNATTGRLSLCVNWNFVTGELRQSIAGNAPRLVDDEGWIVASGTALANLPQGWKIDSSSTAFVLCGPSRELIKWVDSGPVVPLYAGADGTVVIVRQASGLEFLKLRYCGQRIALDGSIALDEPTPMGRALQPGAIDCNYARGSVASSTLTRPDGTDVRIQRLE